MKYLIPFGLLLSLSLTPNKAPLYQVISSHPHDLKELEGHIETVSQQGRLWVVLLKDGAPASLMSHLRPISGRERHYSYRAETSKRLGDFHPEIQQKVLELRSDLIQKDIEFLAGYKTRAAGTDENRRVIKDLQERFRSMGLEVSEVCYREGVCSVIAEKKGKSAPDDVLLTLAHVDSVGRSFAGADDNASGTAVLLEMARVLSTYDNQKTLRFFVTNGEELGLLGAEDYVRRLKRSGEISLIKLAVNMDMVGYNSNGIVELETSPNLETLADWFGDLAAKYTTLKTKITLGAWGSDHVPFIEAQVPALLTIEDWSTKTPCYHASCDLPSTINFGYATEIGKLNLAALLAKDLE